ncbi:MAG: 1-acyl-sn-glycerol-3-phosphate acyltransferase [Betaproteobacteria bacterium]|nr:MAG: 1-acyl-sn-glycerol-3-phosphate acyltransferase [Betaproteobacteria bacterium]TAG84311.1 MAG: 1-acyl-sn-glycerol-3-phosphate acyltransferase [Betaproteobacteria bacterium]
MQAIRNSLYLLLQLIVTPVYALLVCATFWLPAKTRNVFCSKYTALFVWFAKVVCGVRYEVKGWENLPKRPFIVMSKHSSTWETLALEAKFAPASFVAKKELLWVPFFGWAFALSSPININRKAGAAAMDQLIAQGKERLSRSDFVIVVFPEGTRIAAGKQGKYKTGGARLAIGCNVPIVPVAHNAGYCWPRHPWKKHAGLVTMSVLPPIEVAGREVADVNAEVERVIEAEVARLGSGRGL